MATLPQNAANGPTPCRHRRPERTLLYRTVQTHFQTCPALRHGECGEGARLVGHRR